MNCMEENFSVLKGHLDEKTRRLVAAAMVMGGPRGIKGRVSKATGVSYREIRRGMKELLLPPAKTAGTGGLRKKGGGRKSIARSDPGVMSDLREILESSAHGDPASPLLWTDKSLRHLMTALQDKGHAISYPTVGSLLEQSGYRLQANRKIKKGAEHPDRNAQFAYINETVKAFQAMSDPVISVDCKKHESMGDFSNPGREHHHIEAAPKIRARDLADKETGRAIPCGACGLADDTALIDAGIDRDTSRFAVESIRGWWYGMGKELYPKAARLLITVDCSGSDDHGRRLWQMELAKFATETGLEATVCHFPSVTSKWNRIEHRLSSCITMNWRGKTPTSIAVIISLIAPPGKRAGLKAAYALNEPPHPDGVKTSDAVLAGVNLLRHEFHGEWNYTVFPSNYS
jgi:hypothetical protein